MIGSDIFLTFLSIFDLCTNYETGSSCICRSNQSVHKRLKIIHLNFQNMELISVQHNSGQLFQRSNVVHVIPVHVNEPYCAICVQYCAILCKIYVQWCCLIYQYAVFFIGTISQLVQFLYNSIIIFNQKNHDNCTRHICMQTGQRLESGKAF